jgi:hypothetical protein
LKVGTELIGGSKLLFWVLVISTRGLAPGATRWSIDVFEILEYMNKHFANTSSKVANSHSHTRMVPEYYKPQPA